MVERRVILHYHLFKNAGTSLDAILRENFGEAWGTDEFPTRGMDNTALVTEWLGARPWIEVLSSHTMMGPVPVLEGVELWPVMFFRDPLERVRSAYLFERTQDADTWGARLARETDLAGYVTARLDTTNDRQCRDFQTARLAALNPGPAPEFERACAALDLLALAGLVERFALSMQLLADDMRRRWRELALRDVQLNSSGARSGDLRSEVGEAVYARLVEANAQDLALRRIVEERLVERALQAPWPAAGAARP